LEAILEFCVHGLSPSPAGATLVWTLDDSLLTELATSEVRMPSLALQDRTTHAPARHLLSQVDGAALLTSAAELVDIRLYLRASAGAVAAVTIDSTRGTRHASAMRFSYDEPRVVVFVVSQDGPVTVYFEGEAVASIRSRLEEEAL
jgi:DNA integrity scanning protein DisA with diadenylate cyclase activity